MCDEFFSLPLFPQAICDEDALRGRNVSCTCGNYNSVTGLGCNGSGYASGGTAYANGTNYGGCGCCW